MPCSINTIIKINLVQNYYQKANYKMSNNVIIKVKPCDCQSDKLLHSVQHTNHW